MDRWSALPVDLLEAIEECLVLYPDKVRLGLVCTSWQSSLTKMLNHKLCQLPWLLIPQCSDGTSFGLFNPLEKRSYSIELPKTRGKVFRGSSHGWLVTVEDSPAIYAVNPLTGAQVQLPPRSKFPDIVNYRDDKPGDEYALRYLSRRHGRFYTLSSTHVRNYFTNKVVMSSSPTSKDWVAVAIYGEANRLAYCRYGDKRWTSLHEGRGNKDVIFHEERFYAINHRGQLMAFDIGSCKKVTQIVPPTKCLVGPLYLVESGGGLMMVERNVATRGSYDPKRDNKYKTYGFKIYKLDTSSSSWYQVKNLGEDLFFVGINSSLAFSSHDFPGYKGNCIYFTDDALEFHREDVIGGYDVGVFNVDDATIEPLPSYTSDLQLVWPPPIWVMPYN